MMRCLLVLVLLAASAVAETVDDCASLLGSLSVELRAARSLPTSARTSFVCPRDTTPLLGASRQRILNALGAPDDTRASEGHGTRWNYYFSGSIAADARHAGTPRLSFEFNTSFQVSAVSCARLRQPVDMLG